MRSAPNDIMARACQHLGVNMKELAKRVDVSPSTLYGYRHKKQIPSDVYNRITNLITKHGKVGQHQVIMTMVVRIPHHKFRLAKDILEALDAQITDV